MFAGASLAKVFQIYLNSLAQPEILEPQFAIFFFRRVTNREVELPLQFPRFYASCSNDRFERGSGGLTLNFPGTFSFLS